MEHLPHRSTDRHGAALDDEFCGDRVVLRIPQQRDWRFHGSRLVKPFDVARRLRRAGGPHAGAAARLALVGRQASRHGESIKFSAESREWFDSAVDRVCATVVGRRTYEDSGRWGGELPFDWPFFIVTHRPPDDGDSVPFSFVTEGVERAV